MNLRILTFTPILRDEETETIILPNNMPQYNNMPQRRHPTKNFPTVDGGKFQTNFVM
jgi:hypothetical protein